MRPNRASIAELAYQLWVGRGCPDGSDDLDWLEAERQLAAESSSALASEAGLDREMVSSDSAPTDADEKWQRGTETTASASIATSASEQRPRARARARKG
jgi:hypothetical protein